MPTGYTEQLMAKGESFKAFATRCMRSFGACVTMRDDPLDAAIPEQFEPSTYYFEAEEKAAKELRRLKRMTEKEANEYGAKLKADTLKRFAEVLAKESVENTRLIDMQKQVEAWTPPSAGYDGFREFMLDQINISKHDTDYWRKLISETKDTSPEEFFKNTLQSAEADVVYYGREREKEVSRVAERNKWLRVLRASIG